MADDKLSDQDKALFRSMVGKVKPLQSTKKTPSPRTLSVKKIALKKNFDHDSHIVDTYHLSDAYHTPVGAESLLIYGQQKIPRRRLNELKNGHIPWQSRLDLHGLGLNTARVALCQFIAEQYALGHRSLLIIHGKGGLRGEPPVLKNHVYHWIKQFPEVLACHSALPRDGGTGALYVLLRRQRESGVHGC